MRAPLLLPVLLSPLAATAQELAAKIEALAGPVLAAGLSPSLVVGVIDGDTTLVRGFGTVGAGAPGATTLYEIGSVSKVFTGLLLADAVDRGLCKLEDPVQSLLPEGTTMPMWETTPVLLWHLSTHTSGLPRLPNMKGADPHDPYAHFDAERLFAEVGRARIRWQPGSKYEYSNFAVGLLGHLLAVQQELPSYAALLQRRITAPLGLADTTIALTEAQAARLAPPHNTDGEPEHGWNLAAMAGAGGIRSTAADLLQFARAQFPSAAKTADGAPSAAAVALSQRRHHDGADGMAMGLGWHFARDGKTRWHNGGTGGYRAFLAIVPEDRRAVCVLANTTAGQIDAIGERLMQHLYGMPVQPPTVEIPVAVERSALQRLVGSYRLPAVGTMTIALGERGLSAQLTGQPALRIHPRSPTEFVYRAVEATMTFELDGERAAVVVLHQNGQHMRFQRLDGKPAEPGGK